MLRMWSCVALAWDGCKRAGLLAATLTAALAAGATASAQTPAQLEQAVIQATNAYRVANRQKALQVSPNLVRAAQKHARVLAARDNTTADAHNVNGTTIGSRAKAEGYDGAAIGENVQFNQDPRDPAAAAVSWWKGSPGHNANMLRATFEHLGVGAARTASGRWWFVQVFGAGGNPGKESAVVGQAKLDGTYRIQVVGDSRYWQEAGSGDRLVSTRTQPNDNTTRFVLESQDDGSYRIKARGSGRYLHLDGTGDRLLSTRYQRKDDYTHFLFEVQKDGSYRIRVKGNKQYLHEDGTGDKLVSTRYQRSDPYTHFKLVKLVVKGEDPPVAPPVAPPRPGKPANAANSALSLGAIKARMTDLSKKTKAGTYFNTAQVPEDLDGFRRDMLEIGNLGRRDPDYRKKHGEKLATDLSGNDVLIPRDPSAGRPEAQRQKIFKHNEKPPYFKDLVLNDALNKAAQFHAEYQASIGKVGHTGPATYNGAPMKEFWQRAEHFGYKFNMEGEGAGEGPDPAGSPEGWMKSDTHFRPWFNIGADVREVGLGIAKGRNGNWYTCVISGMGK